MGKLQPGVGGDKKNSELKISMKVFKFGGASVKDAGAVRNVAEIMKMFKGEDIIVVVSAMGKTTNALERLAEAFFYNKQETEKLVDEVKKYHSDILAELFPDKSKKIHAKLEELFSQV